MPMTYTNRKGTTYTLFRSGADTGKLRFFFAKSSDKGVAWDTVPEGYEIRESVNGIISLAKKRPMLIRQTEVAQVRDLLQCHPRNENYRLQVAPNMMVIHELTGPDAGEILKIFERHGVTILEDARERLKAHQDQNANYQAVLRFILRDDTDRTFRVERMSYLSGINDWIFLDSGKSLTQLARDTIPLLGSDEFYELY